MKTLLSFLSEPVAVALGWTLLHALWQGFALVMPAALLMHLLRHKSSQLRYNVGVSALLAQVVLSVLTFGWYYQSLLGSVRLSAKTGLTTAVSVPALWPMVSRSLPWHLQVQRFLESHLTEIVVCWLIGVVVFLIRLAGGWLYVQRLKTKAIQPADACWQAGLARLSTRLAIRQPVRVMESMQVLVPMVVGALKPVILLPIGLATGLSLREVEAILAHELAHVKRFDYAVNLLQSVVEVAFFFHPALWWLSARVREERENCCDDLAVLACGDARSLAQALARVEEFSHTPMLAMALASQKKLLLNRVRRMLGVSARPVVSNGHLAVLTLATVLLATVSVYAIQEKQPKPRPKSVKTPSPPTQRHDIPNGTEFGITDNRKVDYIVWQGQKLPATRVAGLQRQLDKVMAGQLNLDDVAQPDRDILLAIIETNQGIDQGTEQNQINYRRIADQALATVNMDSVLQRVTTIDYKAVVQDAFTALSTSKLVADSVIQPAIVDVVRLQDSLLTVRELNAGKVALLSAQSQAQKFAVEAVERKIERLERQKSVLVQKRSIETSDQEHIILKSGFIGTDSGRVAMAKQIEAGEVAIHKTEIAIEALNGQIVDVQSELEKAAKPLRATEAELRKLRNSGYYSYSTHMPTGRTATAIGSTGTIGVTGAAGVRGFVGSTIPNAPAQPEPPEALELRDVYINGNGAARTSRTLRPARSIKGMTVPKPVPPIAPFPTAVRPARPAIPATAPKPPIVPNN